jgi:hypothetical protein
LVYRPGRGAHGALAVCRERCWRFYLAVDLDMKTFFGTVDHQLLLARSPTTPIKNAPQGLPSRCAFMHTAGRGKKGGRGGGAA